MDAITLIEYIIVIVIVIVGSRAVYKYITKQIKQTPKQLRVHLRGQIAAVRDPVLLHYRTNPEVYGVSDDVALSASILRTRVQLWKTILIAGIVGFIMFLIGTGM
jgi:hypothetical protein